MWLFGVLLMGVGIMVAINTVLTPGFQLIESVAGGLLFGIGLAKIRE